MRKERMTLEELIELKPSMENPIELISDIPTNCAYGMEKIQVVEVKGKRFAHIDSAGDLYSAEISHLSAYPSLKPEQPKFVKKTMYAPIGENEKDGIYEHAELFETKDEAIRFANDSIGYREVEVFIKES